MRTPFLEILILGLVITGCGQRTSPPPAASTNTVRTEGNPLSAPADYVGAVGKAAQHSAKVAGSVQVQQAIQQFRVAEDRYPKDLDELVKEGYLPALPRLPAGMKYDYQPATGQLRVVPSQ